MQLDKNIKFWIKQGQHKNIHAQQIKVKQLKMHAIKKKFINKNCLD